MKYLYSHRTGYVGPGPPVSGGPERWTGSQVIDWSSGRLVDAAKAAELRVPLPGLRKRKLKSSAVLKYHVGGPYNGTKLRKTTKIGTKKDSKRTVEILPDEYAVPPYSGRYVFNQEEDVYEWTT